MAAVTAERRLWHLPRHAARVSAVLLEGAVAPGWRPPAQQVYVHPGWQGVRGGLKLAAGDAPLGCLTPAALHSLHKGLASLVAQLVKNPPAMQDTPVQFLGQEDPLKKEIATHSSILAWEIPWTEEPGGYSP